MFKFVLTFLSSLFILSLVAAQPAAPANNPLIQLSGLVITTDSLRGLPLVSVRIKSSSKGTLSDEGGFFSFVARKGDTILFSSIGYKTVSYIVPADLKGVKHTLIQPLSEDTIYLNTAVIRSYPTPDEFDYYFVKATIPNSYYEASTRNLRRKTLQGMAQSMSMDGVEQQQYFNQQQAYRYYYNGQLPPNRIFDPFAWGQFYNAWKRGDYQKK